MINSNRPADIISGCCECVAGQGPKAACKHIAALCFGLLDFDDKKLYDACTQRLQEWHKPTRRSMNPVALLDIDFGYLQHNVKNQESPQYLTFLKDYTYVPRAERTLQQLLGKYNQKSTIAASFFLSEQSSNAHLPLPGRVVSQCSAAFDFSTQPSMIKYYYEKIHVSCNEISMIEIATRGQSACTQWYKEREVRISSTNVYSICVEKYDFQKLAHSILQDKNKNLSSNPAVRHGMLSEEMCRRRYVLEQRRKNICSTTHPSGLVIDQAAPYLCCSPDALVVEVVNHTMSFGILECKCIYADENATWNDLIIARENFCLEWKDNQLQL
ncbi:unnamed protein product, partial [Adineta steineri]